MKIKNIVAFLLLTNYINFLYARTENISLDIIQDIDSELRLIFDKKSQKQSIIPFIEAHYSDTLVFEFVNKTNIKVCVNFSKLNINQCVEKFQINQVMIVPNSINQAVLEITLNSKPSCKGLILIKNEATKVDKLLKWQFDCKIDKLGNIQFTLNGIKYPASQSLIANGIAAKKGDFLWILLYNGSDYSNAIHFEGFHLKVIETNSKRIIKNSIKDSFPVEINQWILLELNVDKHGFYAIRQNIISSNDNQDFEPNGLFQVLQFAP